jgi:hypothetical protein
MTNLQVESLNQINATVKRWLLAATPSFERRGMLVAASLGSMSTGRSARMRSLWSAGDTGRLVSLKPDAITASSARPA